MSVTQHTAGESPRRLSHEAVADEEDRAMGAMLGQGMASIRRTVRRLVPTPFCVRTIEAPGLWLPQWALPAAKVVMQAGIHPMPVVEVDGLEGL